MGRRKRRRVDPTDDWQQLELLCVWEEQREYERIRPLVLFALSALGEGGWIKAMRLKGYAPGRPKALQQACSATRRRFSADPLPTGSGVGAPRRSILVGGDPEPVAVGVPDLDLPRPRGLFHLRAELARRDYDDQGTPTHDHASTPRDQDRAGVRGTAQRTPLTRW